MHPTLYLILSISYAEAAVRSAREGNWHDAVHQAIAAVIYACLAVLTAAPAFLMTAIVDAPL